MDMNNIRFAKSARRHKIGRASARFVIANSPWFDAYTTDGELRRWWVDDDERGRELEIMAITGPRDGSCFVVHVMPTQLRK